MPHELPLPGGGFVAEGAAFWTLTETGTPQRWILALACWSGTGAFRARKAVGVDGAGERYEIDPCEIYPTYQAARERALSRLAADVAYHQTHAARAQADLQALLAERDEEERAEDSPAGGGRAVSP